MTDICNKCKNLFTYEPTNNNRRYCNDCRTAVCANCKKEITVKPSSPKKYCSQNCYWKKLNGKIQEKEHVEKRAKSNRGRKTGKHIPCHYCKKLKYFYPKDLKNRKNKFCSTDCFHEWSRTSDNPNWKGDNHPENKRLRDSLKYKKWRMKVHKKCNFTCQICGFKSKGTKPADIHADHILPWSLHPDKRFDVNNGRTLCVPCHTGTESYGVNAKFLD